jgi:hypothetical protein
VNRKREKADYGKYADYGWYDKGCRSGRRETRNEEEGGSRKVARVFLVWKSKTGEGEWK